MEQQDWGMLLEALLPFANAIMSCPLHVVVVAHSKDEAPTKDAPGDAGLDLQGAIKNKLPGWFDYILHLVSGEDNARHVIFQPTTIKLKSGLVYHFLAGDRHNTFKDYGVTTVLKMDPKTLEIDSQIVDKIMARHKLEPTDGTKSAPRMNAGFRKP
jgi:hypothetical protein